MLGLGRALAAHHPVGVRVEVDGRALHDGVMVTGAVANGQYFGGGMRIAPDAAPDDGQLDVTLLLRQGLREVLAIGDVYSGKAADWATARRGRGSEVTARPLDPATRVLLDVDGEQPGTLPARFRLVPAAVRLKTA
jgi:diacylglycerol kinase family enzyme